jgi:hypothetical protein
MKTILLNGWCLALQAISTFLFLTSATLGLAQISVVSSGSSIETFDSKPGATNWATASLAAGPNTTAALDSAVQAIAATGIPTTLAVNPTNPPGSFALAQWCSSGKYIQTAPTGNGAALVKMVLRNDTGASVSSLNLSYYLTIANTPGTEQIPGHRLYYNLSGSAGSWVPIGTLSTAGSQSIPLNFSAIPWPAGSLLNLLFVDHNSTNNPDGLLQIDNVAITSVVPFACVLVTDPPQSQTVQNRQGAMFSVAASGGPQQIQWYRKSSGGAAFTNIPGATNSDYTIPAVSYPADNGAQFQAVVTNVLCSATSAVGTLRVTPDYIYHGFETAQTLDCWAFTGPWEIGVPTAGPPAGALGRRAYAGTNCAATVLAGNYSDDTSGRLESCEFTVPPASASPRQPSPALLALV